ncbi:MAG: FTR1 family protein [Gammaproteobacteria bacterium]|nr:FTR1 family protein [Gammaproteobacteria bacterium]
MTSAVIIVLREVLEAVLIICMLLASSSALGLRFRWLPPALLAGLAGAFIYAVFLEDISQAFEGFGQEIVNAVLLLLITLLLLAHNILAMREFKAPQIARLPALSLLILSATIAMAIVREGSEIYLYVYSYGVVAGDITSVLSGGAIGAGIGFSLGTFIYFGLRTLSARHCLLFSSFMALVIGAGMSSQAALFLAQADLLSASEPLWDTSALIAESSLPGELLQAVIGYEASPIATQVGMFAGALVLSLAAMGIGIFSVRNLSSNPEAIRTERSNE